MGRKEDALEYHTRGRKGKLEVVPTKPLVSQLDLSLGRPVAEYGLDADLARAGLRLPGLRLLVDDGVDQLEVLGDAALLPARRLLSHRVGAQAGVALARAVPDPAALPPRGPGRNALVVEATAV